MKWNQKFVQILKCLVLLWTHKHILSKGVYVYPFWKNLVVSGIDIKVDIGFFK